jgi:glutathione S-transferase
VLQIFHVPRTRSLRVVWLAEEMRIPYELKAETFGQQSDEFVQANPVGSLPAIVDGDVAMGESIAIMHYLTERYGPTPLARRLGDPGYGQYLQYLVAGEGSMAAFLNPVLATQFRAPEEQRKNVTVDLAKAIFLRRVNALEPLLAKHDYLAGDFTAADISVGYALGMGAVLGLDAQYPAIVRAYFHRLLARPAHQRAVSV